MSESVAIVIVAVSLLATTWVYSCTYKHAVVYD